MKKFTKTLNKRKAYLHILSLVSAPAVILAVGAVSAFCASYFWGGLLPFCIFAGFTLISAVIAVKNAQGIFDPLYKTLNTVSKNGKQRFFTGDILKDLQHQASKNEEQAQTLYTALPYAQEKYLVNYLNATEYYIDENAREILKKSISFEYDYFAVVIIQITPTNRMFDLYNSYDYSNIQGGLYSVIKDLFAAKYPCFVLPGDKDTLYIILNLKTKKQALNIDILLKDMYGFLESDMEYINISVGKSDVYEGLQGLKTAHKEATASLAPHIYDSDRIKIDNSAVSAEYNLQRKDETEFFTALVSFDSQKSHKILNKIIENNADIPLRSQKMLYNNIANIILKAMRIKEVPFKDNKLDFEILNDILNQPPEAIACDLFTLIDYLIAGADTQKPVSGTNVDEIIQYIKENFAFTDLSLEFLAEYFHTASSNISNMIKASLGIGYHEYLTSLRTEAAKDLLSATEKSIKEIYSECGFNSQQTFYRSFKKNTGLTPLEYRIKSKKNENA